MPLAFNVRLLVLDGMELSAIRSQFVRRHLSDALDSNEIPLAQRTAQEFRRNFDWYANPIPGPEQRVILKQLSALEGRPTEPVW